MLRAAFREHTTRRNMIWRSDRLLTSSVPEWRQFSRVRSGRMSCGSRDQLSTLTPDPPDPSTLSSGRRHAIRRAIAAGRFRETLALLVLAPDAAEPGPAGERSTEKRHQRCCKAKLDTVAHVTYAERAG